MLSLTLAALAALAVPGCDGGTSPADRVADISAALADGAPGAIVGRSVDFVVQLVMEPTGSPAEGIEVVVEGPGSFTAPGGPALTDGVARFLSGPNGRTPVGWTPDRVGTSTLSVRAGRVSQEFAVTVLPGGGQVVTVRGPESGIAGQAVAFQVELLDALGRRYAGTASIELSYREDGEVRQEATRSWNGDLLSVDLLPIRAGSAELRARTSGTGVVGSAGFEISPASPHTAAWLDEPPFGRTEDNALGPAQISLEDTYGNPARGTFPIRVSDGGELTADSVSARDGIAQLDGWRFAAIPGTQWLEIEAAPGTWLRIETEVLERRTVASVGIETPERVFRGLEAELEFEFLAPAGIASPYALAEVQIDSAGVSIIRSGRANAEGRFIAPWTPSTEGTVEVLARGDGGAWSSFNVQVNAPPAPTRVVAGFEGAFSGYENEMIQDTIRVRVLDQYGQGMVTEVSIEGQGSFEPATGLTEPDGGYGFRWTPGRGIGEQTALVRAGEVELEITAQVAAERGVDLLGAYIVQQMQNPSHDVRLVAGRPATLRIFPQRLKEGDVQAELSVFIGATFVRGISIPAGAMRFQRSGTLDESNPAWSVNVPIEADEVAPGLRIEGQFTWRETSLPISLVPAVTVTRDVEVTFVPIKLSSGQVGDASATSITDHLAWSEELPFNMVSHAVRDTFVYDGPELRSDGSGWGPLIGAIRELRIQDASNAIYYGLVQPPYTGGGLAGVGYIGTPVSLSRTNLGANGRAHIFNHEVGHNLGRRHAPCGAAPRPDPEFPYGDGRVGAWGWRSGEVINPLVPDVMGYCGGRGFGPFNWNGSLTVAWLAEQDFASVGAGGPVLRVFGSLDSGVLEVVAYTGRSGGRGILRPESSDAASLVPGVLVEILDRAGMVISEGMVGLESLSHGSGQNFATEFSLDQLGGRAEGGLLRVTTQAVEESPVVREIRLGSEDEGSVEFNPELYGPLPIRDASGALMGFARDAGSVPAEHFVQLPGLQLQMGRIVMGRLEPTSLFRP